MILIIGYDEVFSRWKSAGWRQRPNLQQDRKKVMKNSLIPFSNLQRSKRGAAAVTLAIISTVGLGLSGCASSENTQSETQAQPESSDNHTGDGVEAAGSATEQETAVPRLAMTYDGGIMIYDAETLKPVSEIELDGFNRISPAGNGQDLMVSTTGMFQVLDAGTWAQGHGDHFHYFTDTPTLTDVSYLAETPGHVVTNAGKTALFDDKTGLVQIIASDEIDQADATVTEYQSENAHHGVAVPLEDDTLLVTEGTEDERSTLLAVKDGKTVEENNDCLNIHGEAVSAHEIVAFGCADGALLYHDGKIEKIQSPDQKGRLSTLVGSENSHYILGNYNPDYSADTDENELTNVAIIDAENEKITVVDIGTAYSFRSLAIGDNGEALVLGTDGKLHVINPETATEIGSYQVIDPWELPEEWQTARPAVYSYEGTAYITNPETKTIYAMDIETGEIWNEATLAQIPNELTGVSGNAEATSSANDEHDHSEDSEHEDDGHNH